MTPRTLHTPVSGRAHYATVRSAPLSGTTYTVDRLDPNQSLPCSTLFSLHFSFALSQILYATPPNHTATYSFFF